MSLNHVSLKKVLPHNAHYNLLIGERSNGKTFCILEYAIQEFWDNGSEFAYIRRWVDDIRGKRMIKLFDGLIENDKIAKITHGEYNTVLYDRGDFWLANKTIDGDIIRHDKPFGTTFALTAMEHDKSVAFPRIRTILFDEFLTRKMYLPDEFVLFSNVLSTIIRLRDDVKIFMCGNTVNAYSPYFKEMGLTNIKKMKQGDIDVYRYGESQLKVLVYFTDSVAKSKKSDVYFAFDNPKLSMITGKGNVWEIDIYPHLPQKYTPNMILFNYYIEFDGELLECDMIQDGHAFYTYIHRKTTPLKYPEKDIIFSLSPSPLINWRENIRKPPDKIGKKIYSQFVFKKIFYQDNEVGEIVRNYLNQCDL